MKKMHKSVKTVVLFLTCLLVGFMFLEEDKKNRVEEFLDKIREILKKVQELQNQAKKKKDKSNKAKIRQMIIEKLANPYSRLKHFQIKTKKDESNTSNDSLKTGETSTSQISPTFLRRIQRIFRQNPNLLPFTLPNLAKYTTFGKRGKEEVGDENKSSNKKESDGKKDDKELTKMKEFLDELFSQLIEKMLNFWTFEWRLFSGNEKRFNFIKNNICKDEIYVSGGMEAEDIFENTFLWRLKGDLPQQLKPDEPISPFFNILNITSFYDEVGKSTQYVYSLYKKEGASVVSRKTLDFKKSPCYNLSVFESYGRKLITENETFKKVERCWRFLHSKQPKKLCNWQDIQKMYKLINKYLSLALQIYKNQIIPAFFNLCNLSCLCPDLGIRCGSGAESDETTFTLYILLYKTVKSVENINDEWYEQWKSIEKEIDNLYSSEYTKKKETKCSFEEDFYKLITNFYTEWEKIKKENPKGLAVETKIADEEFLKALKNKDTKEVEKSYMNFLKTIYKIKEVPKAIVKLTKDIEEFFIAKTKGHFLCSSYLLGTFIDKFYKVAIEPPPVLRKYLNFSFENIVKKLPPEERGKYTGPIFYFEVKRRLPTTFIAGNIFLQGKYNDDTVNGGVNVVDTILGNNHSQWGALDYLVFIDYHTYFYFNEYKLLKCVKGLHFSEYVGRDNKKERLLNCLFEKKDFKKCMEETYVTFASIKKIWDEFFGFLELENLKFADIKQILSNLAEKVVKENKTYAQFFPSVGACCGGGDLCSEVIGIPQDNLKEVCVEIDGKLPICAQSPSNWCKLCFDNENKEITCHGDEKACTDNAAVLYRKCNKLMSDFYDVIQALLENFKKLDGFCQNSQELISKCKSIANVQCGTISQQKCETLFKLDSYTKTAIATRKSLPKITEEELNMIVSADKIECPK
jgi:hypothetical protein